MTISDETLSAFLDSELPEQEMDDIRSALARDEALANRLAEMTMTNMAVGNAYRTIDDRPLPAALATLLESEGASRREAKLQSTENIVTFPIWKRINRTLQQNAALAACLALVAGVVLSQGITGFDRAGDDDWQQITAALEAGRSGVPQTVGEARLTPQLTFVNQDGDYCRQYALSSSDAGSQNIACNTDGDWTLIATLHTASISNGTYQTASGGTMLDGVLDRMMAGTPLSADQEAAVIDNSWQSGGD